MSILIAIKDSDNIYIGADNRCTVGDVQGDDVSKLKKTEYCGTVIGVTGYLRDFNIIECVDTLFPFDSVVSKLYVINNIVPFLYDLYESQYRVLNENGIKYFMSDFLIATNNHIFTIGSDGAVQEHNKYAVLGSGSDFAYGYLDTVNNWSNPYNIVETAITNACDRDIYIGDTAQIIRI